MSGDSRGIPKLDRLDWAEGVAVIAYGVRFGIRANKPGVIEQYLPALPPSWRFAGSPGVGRMYSIIAGGEGPRRGLRLSHIVYADGERIARAARLQQATDALESNVQLYVAEMSPRRVFVHAGVVGWRGQAVVIPGRSFSGKTTLTAALIKAGCTYYSDEYAVLDSGGRVHPYTRLLGIRENGQFERSTRYHVEALGGTTGAKPLPVALVIVSQYRPGARWRPRRLTAGEGALAMLENTVSARREPQAALSTLHRAVAASLVFKGARGEAEQVVDFIFGMLGKRA
ncbi:MAG TPA: hypothetical protein VJZ91_15480 [Blastocatellia bacterium]|nr:hypothetical protein [Blastocatellia bacterium]